MEIIAEARASILLFDDIEIEVSRDISVNVDCMICKRLNRTVVVKEPPMDSICIKMGHEFPAVLEKVTIDKTYDRKSLLISKGIIVNINYLINLKYESFINKTDGDSSKGLRDWARMIIYAHCPSCHTNTKRTIQTNIRIEKCECKRCNKLLWQKDQNGPETKVIDIRD